MSDIVKRLQARTARNWVHSPGDTPRIVGYKPDPDCAEAADSLKAQAEKIRVLREALELIAAPMRPCGTWNRDRLACQQLAVKALEATK